MSKRKAAPKPTKPRPLSLVQRRHYARLWVAANQALILLEKMEEAGALRLPFIGYQATVDNLRNAVQDDRV